jgi:hypothetical protein
METMTSFDSPKGRSRAAAKISPAPEPLEDRSLLSSIHVTGPTSAPPGAVQPAAYLQIASRDTRPPRTGLLYRGSLNERIDGATVVKHPEFYELYKGPKLAALDAIGASGRFVHAARGFTFTGRLLGPVDPSRPAYYAFLIDRGGAKEPGPYPHRTDIFFDAVAVVATGPGGTTARLTLLNPKGKVTSSTPLPAEDVRVQNNEVAVTIPTSSIPSTSMDALRYHIGQYRYNFSPRASLDAVGGIASFVPEYITAPIGKPR